MSDNIFLIREEPIQRLERVVSAMLEAVRRSDLDKDMAIRALGAALAGECPRCRVQVQGDELLTLAQLPASRDSNPRIARLRRGRCANEQCGHQSFRLILKKHPDLDWAKLFSQAGTTRDNAVPAPEELAVKPAAAFAARHRTSFRVGAIIVLGLLLILLRQWYLGGEIPLLREPEQFRVDPLPAGAETNKPDALPHPSHPRKP